MPHSKRRAVVMTLAVLLTVACACPLSLPNLNPLAGAQGTVQALASQMPEGALSTLQAAATMLPEGSVETVMAVAPTLMSEETIKTAQAGMEEFADPSKIPADIPTPDDKTLIQASADTVQFNSGMTVAELSAFYKEKMPANGWRFEDKGSSESAENATLVYKKDDRKANISITDLMVTRLVIIEIMPE